VNDPVASTGNQIGKRYTCAACGSEIMCVKRGEGTFTCHGAAMVLVAARPLPSSD
jgi:hypothetical protein